MPSTSLLPSGTEPPLATTPPSDTSSRKSFPLGVAVLKGVVVGTLVGVSVDATTSGAVSTEYRVPSTEYSKHSVLGTRYSVLFWPAALLVRASIAISPRLSNSAGTRNAYRRPLCLSDPVVIIARFLSLIKPFACEGNDYKVSLERKS